MTAKCFLVPTLRIHKNMAQQLYQYNRLIFPTIIFWYLTYFHGLFYQLKGGCFGNLVHCNEVQYINSHSFVYSSTITSGFFYSKFPLSAIMMSFVLVSWASPCFSLDCSPARVNILIREAQASLWVRACTTECEVEGAAWHSKVFHLVIWIT